MPTVDGNGLELDDVEIGLFVISQVHFRKGLIEIIFYVSFHGDGME